MLISGRLECGRINSACQLNKAFVTETSWRRRRIGRISRSRGWEVAGGGDSMSQTWRTQKCPVCREGRVVQAFRDRWVVGEDCEEVGRG